MLFIKKAHTARDFDSAREYMMSQINARNRSFTVETEFGTMFCELTRESREPIYRYTICSWNEAPINRETKYHIRNSSITHYCLMQKVSNQQTQEWMVVMALTHMFIEYCTGGNYLAISRDNIDAMALAYCEDRGIISTNPGTMTSHYMSTMGNTGTVADLFRRAKEPSIEGKEFIYNFFDGRCYMKKKVMYKAQKNFNEVSHGTVDLPDDDAFYHAVLQLVINECHIRLRRNTDAFEVFYTLLNGNKVLTFPTFCKRLVQSNTDGIELPRPATENLPAESNQH